MFERIRTWVGAGLVVLTTGLAVPGLAQAGYAGVYSFGDSLSDNGASLTAAALQAAAPARASNGPVAVEVLAARLGTTLHDYAIGGAKTDATNSDYQPGDRLHDSGMRAQVAAYLGSLPIGGAGADPTALYLLAGGSNDVLEAMSLGQLADPDAVSALLLQMADNLVLSVSELYARGARQFLLSLLPDLGATPEARAMQVSGELSALSQVFNAGLQRAFSDLAASLPDARVVVFDLMAEQQTIHADPGAYGLSNVSDACPESQRTLPQGCAGYFYWDELHPTAATSQLMGADLAAALPEPGTFALAALTLAGLAIRRLRRRA